MTSEEVNYKKNFCEKYFDKGTWDLDVLNQVDVLLKDKKGNILLYIESKFKITNETLHKQALAQVILTNKKQTSVLDKVALIYQDEENNDLLEFIDCSENSIMYNNDINWKAERASMPSKDAVDRINDRIKGKITVYTNDEIKEFYKLLKSNLEIVIDITEKNFNVVYNQWKNEIKFKEQINDEQDLINLFLVDILNGTKYKQKVLTPMGDQLDETEQPLIREGTHLNNYQIMYFGENIDGIKYSGEKTSLYYTISDKENYSFFWKKYKRPPEKNEFLKILERSSTLYSEKYRKDTGGEYTPTCFVEKQNEILAQHYNMNDFIVFDPCCGVGNLENQFGKDFKQNCYLSTLEQMDVDICQIKGFENSVQFDYLKNDEQPKWKYKGTALDITEICKRENKKLMIVMNPPYQNVKGKKNNLAIEFFNKVVKLQPQVIVFYYMTESFLRSEIENYKASNYKIVSHIFSSAKTTFQLSDWPISQVIFDKDIGNVLDYKKIETERYELEKGDFNFKGKYFYDYQSKNLMKEIENKIKSNNKGMILGEWCYLSNVINLINKDCVKSNCSITTQNLIWCLLMKGLIFNAHGKYFERNIYVFKGDIEQISKELFSDSIMFSLFYVKNAFSNKNKGQKNYIMPFTAEELGCNKNDLNVLFPQDLDTNAPEFNFDGKEQEEIAEPFDFRKFLSQFNFSKEAKDLYFSALEIFKYYHKTEEYFDKDYNDSFYDITNAIMGKNPDDFSKKEDINIYSLEQHRTTKGTKGFGKNTIKYAVSSKYLPIFTNFFEKRDILAKKINKQLLDAGLLLWERENIY